MRRWTVLRLIVGWVMGIFVLANIMLGVEPQVRPFDTVPIKDASYDQFIKTAVESPWGDNWGTRALATLVYPGTYIGAKLHNWLL